MPIERVYAPGWGFPGLGKGKKTGRVAMHEPANHRFYLCSCDLDASCLAPPQVTAYALDSVQQRGRLFVTPGDQVYEGQVIGIYQRSGDLKVGRGCPHPHRAAACGHARRGGSPWCAAGLQ